MPPTVPNLPQPTLMGTTTSVNCDSQNLLSPRAKTSLTKTAALKVTSGSPNSDPQRRCSAEAAPKPRGAPATDTAFAPFLLQAQPSKATTGVGRCRSVRAPSEKGGLPRALRTIP